MRSWIEIFDKYMQEVAGCTTFAACDALRNAAQVFCERTKAWRQDLDPITTIDSRFQDYDFDLCDEMEIIKVFSAKLNGRDLQVLNGHESGQHGVQIISPVAFRLHPAQARGQRLVFNVALEPSNTASGMDSWVADKYARTLAKGAKAELFAQSDKPYTNPDRALMLRAEFEQEMASAMADVAKSYSSARSRVRAQFM